MRVLSIAAATIVALSSSGSVAAIPVVKDARDAEADPWGPICFVIPGAPKKPCTYWKEKRQETPVIIKPGPAHVSIAPIHTPKPGLAHVPAAPARFGGLGHVSVAPLPVTRVSVIPIDEPTPTTAKLQVIPIEKRAPEPTFVTTFTIPFGTIPLTPGVTVSPPFKTTITLKPPSSETTSTRLSSMTPIKVSQTPRPTTPIPTFTITSKPTRSIPTFTITSPAPPAEPALEIPTAIDLTSTFQPTPSPKPILTSSLDLGPLVPPSSVAPQPTTSLIQIPTEGLTFTSSLNLGPLVPPTTTTVVTPSPTPISIPTEGLKFSSQLTLPLIDPVTARSV
ncbi:hypothetical protein B0T21DRAFT_455985 [Apiosordaria backusii]|uniref:Uncharacterized protein n=1 Tax=Apiosordaria backusii TaxID=314023 RepID=A0AA40DF53_9PEZI|nr:hypothetical protein B0T21DRAFT_455985 [Apiosordaria backusii]